jgi:hypothetical protein
VVIDVSDKKMAQDLVNIELTAAYLVATDGLGAKMCAMGRAWIVCLQ